MATKKRLHLSIEPDRIWDIVEDIVKRRTKKPSMKLFTCDESFWFHEALVLKSVESKIDGKTFTKEEWGERYGFSIHYIKKLLRDKENVFKSADTFEKRTGRPLRIRKTLKEFDKRDYGSFDWLIGIRTEGIRRDSEDKFVFLDRYIMAVVIEVINIYHRETRDRSLWRLLDSKEFIKKVYGQATFDFLLSARK